MAYYISSIVSKPFDAVVTDVIARLKQQGFGLLSDIDVQAHEALLIENKLGVLLPCNVVVRETPDHRVEVASVDPVAALERTGNSALQATAEEVRRRLTEVATRQAGS